MTRETAVRAVQANEAQREELSEAWQRLRLEQSLVDLVRELSNTNPDGFPVGIEIRVRVGQMDRIAQVWNDPTLTEFFRACLVGMAATVRQRWDAPPSPGQDGDGWQRRGE